RRSPSDTVPAARWRAGRQRPWRRAVQVLGDLRQRPARLVQKTPLRGGKLVLAPIARECSRSIVTCKSAVSTLSPAPVGERRPAAWLASWSMGADLARSGSGHDGLTKPDRSE